MIDPGSGSCVNPGSVTSSLCNLLPLVVPLSAWFLLHSGHLTHLASTSHCMPRVSASQACLRVAVPFGTLGDPAQRRGIASCAVGKLVHDSSMARLGVLALYWATRSCSLVSCDIVSFFLCLSFWLIDGLVCSCTSCRIHRRPGSVCCLPPSVNA